MKLIKSIVVLLFSGSILFAQERVELGARAIGLAGAFVGISDDANGLYWNPAGISTFLKHQLNFDFARLHWGIQDELLANGGIGYIHNLKKLGSIGVRAKFFSSELFRQIHFSFSYSNLLLGSRERGLFYGFTGGFIRDSYNQGKFQLEEHNDPLLQKTTLEKTVPVFDAGLLYRLQRYSLGLAVKNINQPTLSISEPSDKLPLVIFSGLSYKIKDNVLSAVSFEFKYENLEKRLNIFYSLGGEYWHNSGKLGFRGGISAGEITKKGLPQELNLGASFRTRSNMRFDYAFVYPLTSLAGAGSSTHRLSLLLEFQPPKEKFIDLFTSNDLIHPNLQAISVGDSLKISGSIKNIGDKTATGFYITTFISPDNKNWTPLDLPKKINQKLKPGDSTSFDFSVKPTKPGKFQLMLRANDDGKLFPDLNPRFKELSLENNIGITEFDVYALPKASISVEPSKVTFGRTVEIKEEEPIMPVFFFEPGSAILDSRFMKILSLVAKRLKNNPDIIVELRGYYNPLEDNLENISGNELAFSRAIAVYNALVQIDPDLKEQLKIVKEDYLPSMQRSGTIIGTEIEKDIKLVNEENRRVELTVVPKNKIKTIEIPFEPNLDTFNPGLLEELPIAELRSLLNRNPDLVVFVEGFSTETEEPEFLGLKRALNVKRALTGILGENYDARICIYYNDKIRPYRGVARIKVLAEPMIFRPTETILGLGELSILQSKMDIRFSADVMAGIREAGVWIEDEKGENILTLVRGLKSLDTAFSWNLTDKNGKKIEPNKKYFVKLLVDDNLGKSALVTSEPIETEIFEQIASTEILFIVNFELNRTEEESKFQVSRLKTIAKKIINEASKSGEYKLKLTFYGHTDIVGLGPRNRFLSDLRARIVLNELKRYISVLLGLKGYDELDNWLKVHNIILGSEGVGWSKPYIIESRNELIGDNKLPEGRLLNRRAMLKIEKIQLRGKI